MELNLNGKVVVVTGGSSGIGAQIVAKLKEQGHETVNIDLKDGDISANLATKEGRESALRELYDRYPDGIDAMICNAGVSAASGNIPLIIFLSSPLAHGINGVVLFVDGGTDALLNSEKVY